MEKNQGFTTQTVMINGQSANLFVADLNEGQILSVISTSLLQRLTKLLPKASAEDIITEFIDKLQGYVNGCHERPEEVTVDALIEMMQEEMDFHKSVNLINEFFLEEESGSPQPVEETYGVH